MTLDLDIGTNVRKLFLALIKYLQYIHDKSTLRYLQICQMDFELKCSFQEVPKYTF